MSLPDYLLDEDDGTCEECGSLCDHGRLCAACRQDLRDLYADEAIEDRKERGLDSVERDR